MSTEEQDLDAQRDGLAALGVESGRIYGDYADRCVMPTSAMKPLARKVSGLEKSA